MKGNKLVTMGVIEELNACLGKGFSGTIKNRRRFTRRLFIKRIFVRDPCAAGVFESEQSRFCDDLVDVIATLFVREVAANSL